MTGVADKSARAGHEPSQQAVSAVPVGVPNAMTDAELAEALLPGKPNGEAAIARMTPERRATYERMIWVGNELNAGRIPPGVLV